MLLPTALALFGLFPAVSVPASPATTTNVAPTEDVSIFAQCLDGAERAIAANELPRAHELVMRALERDAKSTRAWGVRALWAEKAGDRDELVYALHTQLRYAVAQKAPKPEIAALRERLVALDPIAKDLFGMNAKFIGQLEPIAAAYEKDKRPHSAIRVHKLILAIDPEYAASQAAIDRISSLPDPSLAGDAKPKDLLADVSDEWIRAFDAQHATWDTRASLERENYVTYTNAGYEVLVRAAEAMEQMNRFYRIFFQYGTEEDGKSVPRIVLNIFKLRSEYLKLGEGPPVEWSGGHFTGGAVETYVEGNGFEGMTNTLFHEAAHQFVSLATNAAGWLNEGLASFFEGCRILPNGTVLMNLPATQRLFPLAERMEKGWMANASDGIPKEGQSGEPEKSPTFRIVVENEYSWGPPWYAPTWGVVFFLYNYQDPVDGRFVYRRAFRQYVDASGGLQGKTAVKKFEEIVLGQPLPPIKGVDRKGAAEIALPKTIDELDAVWKAWTVALRDEQIGKVAVARPYLSWARSALLAKDDVSAAEHFEKGLVATPNDPELLREFAEFLAEHKNADRAAKLALSALQVLENAKPVDAKAVERVDKLLSKWDPKRGVIEKAQRELAATAVAVVGRYRDGAMPMMVMDLSWRLGNDLEIPALFEEYRAAMVASGKSLALYELAYNEKNLEGWDTGGNDAFKPSGPALDAKFGEYAANQFDYQILTLDRVTAGDYSLEAQVLTLRGEANFCGLVFGRKNAGNFHTFLFFPGAPKGKDARAADNAWVDMASFYGGGATKTWRHTPVAGDDTGNKTSAGRWRTMRIDVSGGVVDCWMDGELVASQDFGTRDVLAGTFGLIQGRGTAHFKDIRFLARDPRDPSGAIERDVKMAKLRRSGEAVGGSYQGLVPPFPKVARWVQAPRTSWEEKPLTLQLLVLWSIDQNELIPLHDWLTALDQKYASKGLTIVSIASPNDAGAIDAYLKDHRFPGSVAVDDRPTTGMGETHTAYFTSRFHLPRLLLLDVDRKVVWEGDPGFKINVPWKAGDESFLDAPLAECVERRKLDTLAAWQASWTSGGAQALAEGDFARAFPAMIAAKELDGALLPLAYDAQRKLAALEALFTDPEATAAKLDKMGRGGALRTLLEWSRVLTTGKEPDKRTPAKFKNYLENAGASGWERALKLAETNAPKLASKPELLAETITKLGAMKGAFPAELAADLQAAGTDLSAAARILTDAPRRAPRWLATWLGW